MSFLKLMLDLIYPPKCMVCNNIIPINKPKWLCDDCKNLLKYIEEPTCIKCSRHIEEEKSFCTQCVNKDFYFCKNFSVYEYEGVVQSVIYKFKYGNNPSLGKGLAKFMVDKFEKQFFLEFDFLVPVPLHKKRKRKRGFNQTEILSSEISNLTGVKSINNLLVRKKNTKSQSKLSPKERINNLKGAFDINKKINIKGKRILIIDDIYTTGSTIDACSKVLLENGADTITGLTLTIVLKKGNNNFSNNILENY